MWTSLATSSFISPLPASVENKAGSYPLIDAASRGAGHLCDSVVDATGQPSRQSSYQAVQALATVPSRDHAAGAFLQIVASTRLL
jgi:hypothetical protein